MSLLLKVSSLPTMFILKLKKRENESEGGRRRGGVLGGGGGGVGEGRGDVGGKNGCVNINVRWGGNKSVQEEEKIIRKKTKIIETTLFFN